MPLADASGLLAAEAGVSSVLPLGIVERASRADALLTFSAVRCTAGASPPVVENRSTADGIVAVVAAALEVSVAGHPLANCAGNSIAAHRAAVGCATIVAVLVVRPGAPLAHHVAALGARRLFVPGRASEDATVPAHLTMGLL